MIKSIIFARYKGEVSKDCREYLISLNVDFLEIPDGVEVTFESQNHATIQSDDALTIEKTITEMHADSTFWQATNILEKYNLSLIEYTQKTNCDDWQSTNKNFRR